MSARLRCVVAEDEVEARTSLERYLADAADVDLAGVASSGAEAVALVEERRPDLLLLDVRMPEMDGLEVLRRLSHRPEVVFTTAYEAYAVAAFELGALDYLVKPFGRERLLAALERVRARLGSGRPGETSVDRALDASRRPLRRLFARRGDRIVPIAVDDIVRVSASGPYSEVRTRKDGFLVQVPLRDLEACLDPGTFERVHRSHIVNLDAVDHFRPADDRRVRVVLADGSSVVASRAASEALRARVR